MYYMYWQLGTHGLCCWGKKKRKKERERKEKNKIARRNSKLLATAMLQSNYGYGLVHNTVTVVKTQSFLVAANDVLPKYFAFASSTFLFLFEACMLISSPCTGVKATLLVPDGPTPVIADKLPARVCCCANRFFIFLLMVPPLVFLVSGALKDPESAPIAPLKCR